MKKKSLISILFAVLLVLSFGTLIFADDDVTATQSSLVVKTVHKTETVYENCQADFQVIATGVDEGTELTYEWFIASTNTIAENQESGWVSMGDKYFFAEGTDTATLVLTIPEGYADKYGSDNTLVFRCKVSDGINTAYSYSYHLEILSPSYADALAFDDEYQVPVLAGDSGEFVISPTDYYLIKFAAAALPALFPSDIYSVKAGIRVDGELVVESDVDYARLERGYSSGHYLVTEELYLLKNGVKVATLSRDIIVYVANDCIHNWEFLWTSASCSKDGINYYKCSYCGAVKEENAVASGEHSWVEEVAYTVDSTCNCEGQKTYYCSVCGEVITETVAAKGHAFSDSSFAVVGDDLVQTGDCTVCGAKYADYLKHNDEEIPVEGSFREWTEDETRRVDATCSQTGQRVYIDTDTKEEFLVTVPYIAHTPGEWVNDSSSDCNSTGSRHLTCAVCGQNIYNNEGIQITEILPAGHDWEVSTKSFATCTEDGLIEWTCSRCGEIETQTVQAVGQHNIVCFEAEESTCLSEGWTQRYVCTECGNYFSDESAATVLGKESVYLGFDEENHIGGQLSYDGNQHYTVCVCLDKIDAHSHSLFGSICKTCGYEKGTLSEYDMVEKLCDKLNISELILLVAVIAIFVILLIITIVLLIIMLRNNKGKKGKSKKNEKNKKKIAGDTPTGDKTESFDDESFDTNENTETETNGLNDNNDAVLPEFIEKYETYSMENSDSTEAEPVTFSVDIESDNADVSSINWDD